MVGAAVTVCAVSLGALCGMYCGDDMCRFTESFVWYVGETGGNNNTFCFGSSGTETI